MLLVSAQARRDRKLPRCKRFVDGVEVEVQQLNQLLSGWGNYFRLGYVTGAWQIVQQHACRRLRQWLQRKTKSRGGPQNPPDLRLYEEYGLLKLTASIRRKPLWA